MLGAKERHWEKQAKARDKNNREKRCLPAAKQDASVTASPDFQEAQPPPAEAPKLSRKSPSCTRPDSGQTQWMCKEHADLIYPSCSGASGYHSLFQFLVQFCQAIPSSRMFKNLTEPSFSHSFSPSAKMLFTLPAR